MANRLDTQSTVSLVINGNQASTSLRELTAALNAVRNARARMNQVDDPARYQELIRQERALTAATRERRNEVNQSEEEQKGFFATFKKGFTDIKGLVTGVALGELVADGLKAGLSALKNMVSAGLEAYKTFEKFDIILTNTLGNKSASKQALSDLTKFAADTPFEMEELTSSFIKFVNRGVKPTMEEMTKMGDLTSSQGKSFDQLTEAILDAMTGEFERLKEFGIRAQKNGDTVKLTFKGITTEVANTDEAIKNAVISFGAMDGVAGGMEKLSKSASGLDSNIEDNTNRVLARVGKAVGGFIYNIKSVYNNMLSLLADTRTESEKLTEEYTKQAGVVQRLEKNTRPLINRYDELKSKGELNRNEQTELKKIIGQIADVIPSAVTQWDKYGNALGINTTKAREYLAVQQQLLKYQNREAIDATQDEIAKLKQQRDAYLKLLNSGKTTFRVTGGTVGTGTEITRALTDKEILGLRAQIQDINASMNDANLRLKGLNGDYLNDLTKKAATTATQVKQITQMTVGELQKYIESSQESLKSVLPKSAEYRKINADIEAAQKLLNPEKAAKASERERDKAAKDLQSFTTQLAELSSQANALIVSAEKGNYDEVAAKLQVIDDKYAKIIEKAKLLQNNKQATPEDKEQIAGIIAGAEGNSMQEKLNTGTDSYFKLGLDELNSQYAAENDALKTRYANNLLTEGEYNDQKNALTQRQLEDEYFLRVTYMQDTGAIETQLADHAIMQKKRETDAKLKYMQQQQKSDKEYFAIQKDIQSQRDQLAMTGMNLLGLLFGKSKAMIIAQLVLEKSVAIGKVIAHEGVEIAGYYAAYASIPFVGVAQATALATAAKIRTGYTIASIVGEGIIQGAGALSSGSGNSSDTSSSPATPPPSTRRAKKGALIPQGPTHEQGGINLVDNRDGNIIAEMEGDEPIFIYSKETYRNNKQLIDALMFNSLYRNGATVDVPEMSKSIRVARNGGVINAGPAADPTGTGADQAGYDSFENAVGMLAEQTGLLQELVEKVELLGNRPIDWNDRAYEQYKGRKQENMDRANP